MVNSLCFMGYKRAFGGFVARFSAVLVVVTLLMACGRHRVPGTYPKPEEMALILAELHMLESTLGFAPMRGNARLTEIPGSYKFVLERHGLTTLEFDTIRKWYVDHPELYQDVYRMVLEELSRMEADVRIYNEREKEQQRLAEQEAVQALLSNLWQDSTRLVVAPEDSSDSRLPFRIAVDTLALQGRLKLSAGYRFLHQDESREPRIMLSAFYNDSVADTVYHVIAHSFQEQVQELSLDLKRDTFPKYIDGFLLLQDSLTASSAQITDLRLQVLTDSVEEQNAKLPALEKANKPVLRKARER